MVATGSAVVGSTLSYSSLASLVPHATAPVADRISPVGHKGLGPLVLVVVELATIDATTGRRSLVRVLLGHGAADALDVGGLVIWDSACLGQGVADEVDGQHVGARVNANGTEVATLTAGLLDASWDHVGSDRVQPRDVFSGRPDGAPSLGLVVIVVDLASAELTTLLGRAARVSRVGAHRGTRLARGQNGAPGLAHRRRRARRNVCRARIRRVNVGTV